MLNGVSETIQNETQEQKRVFFGMLLGALTGSLLGNMLAGKGNIRAVYVSEKFSVKGLQSKDFQFKKKERNYISWL